MISTQYFQQDGILRETANQRFNFRSNLDAQLGIVKLGLNLSGSRQNIDEPTTSVTRRRFDALPYLVYPSYCSCTLF